MRGPLEGLWLRNLRGWRMTFRNPDGGVVMVLTNTAPGRLLEPINISLDGLGTLESLSFDWRGRFDYGSSELACFFELHDAVYGWQEVAEGWLEQPNSRRKRSSPKFSNFWKLIADAPYNGQLPPGIPELGIVGLNFSGRSAPALDSETRSQTVAQALSKAAEGQSDISVGVDAARRMIMARPGQGSPVVIPAKKLLDWEIGDYENPPYITDVVASPGPGWAGFSDSNPRGPLVPRKMRTASTTTKDIKSSTGMPLIGSYLGWITDKPPPPDPLPEGWEQVPDFVDSGWDPTSGLSYTYTGQGQSAYLVYDPQRWRDLSALIESNQSTYQPKSAYIRVGVTLLSLSPPPMYSADYAVVLDEAIWPSSEVGPDKDAVGKPSGPGLDPSPIHPEESPKTAAKPFRNKRARLYREDIGKKQVLDYEIPAQLFTEDQTGEFGERWTLHIAASMLLEHTNGVPPDAEFSALFEFVDVQFGQTVASPGDMSTGMGLNPWEGPSATAEAKGAVLGPAQIQGIEIQEGVPRSIYAVSFDIAVAGRKSATAMRLGLLPYSGALNYGGASDYSWLMQKARYWLDQWQWRG